MPDTGTLRGDLEAIGQGSGSAGNQFDAQLMMASSPRWRTTPSSARSFESVSSTRTRRHSRASSSRRSARGEVDRGRNLELLVSLYPALMLQHVLKFGEIPGAHFAQQVIDDVIMPLATAPVSRPPRRLRVRVRVHVHTPPPEDRGTTLSVTQSPPRSSSNTEGKHLGLALAVISAAQLMIILDATIVNVALPTIHTEPALLDGQPRMAHHRLLPHVRGVAALRWPHR